MNLVKIATACAVECERQQVGIRELQALLRAYQEISHPERVIDIENILALGLIVEPVKNFNGFRIAPVTFQNGGSSAGHAEIPRLMQNLVDDIDYYQKNPNNKDWVAGMLTREFLWIHPFADGNGRVGFLLYNYLMGTLDEPLALPDFGW